ncbi:homocitrate synthase [Clostridium felsineum]|uniref:homocitrate synthase/isopropylmalate synthase family protein n=1 Tax=Clostridium felsineum TaxID=36839 RepID=UPI00214DC1D4|nr:homocitrate synthase [Clostridium felsineum]MCR3761616.1 homocitrate synthase [Clostridium felsineum]
MAVLINNKKKFLIDRTLIENSTRLNELRISRKEMDIFLELINKIGADLFEIDRSVISYIKTSNKFIYRIKDEKDVRIISEYKFKYIIIQFNTARSFNNYNITRMNKFKIILEVDIEELGEIFSDNNYEIFNNFNITCIRINNVYSYNLKGWNEVIRKIKKTFNVLVDFYPSNKQFMATAVAVEACIDGSDFITTAFCGEHYNISSLEEVLLALKVIKNAKILGCLKFLSEASKLYENLFEKSISPTKPIIGRDIFKCESGIHVDGIEKNSLTYEAYEPGIVGSKRQVVLGKHSGKMAIKLKLKELNIKNESCNLEEILEYIREKSIELHRNISNEEFREIYYRYTKGCELYENKFS